MMTTPLMSPMPDPLDFDPRIPGGYSVPMPVLGQGPIMSPTAAAPVSASVLGAAPMDLAAFEIPRPGEARPVAAPPPRVPLSVALASFGIGAPAPAAPPAPAAAPPAPPMLSTAPTLPAGAQTRSMPSQSAATSVPDTFMGVDLTSAKKALAEYQREQPVSELGRIAYGLRTAESNAAQGALSRASEAQPAAVQMLEQAQEAERAAQANRAELASQQAEAARVAEENAAIEREQRRQAVQETAEKLDAATKALDDSKLDVEAAYGGAAGRIFAGLAVALGSFGASLTGGPNYAMQLVNQRIDRELDAQRTEIEKRKGKVSQLGQLLQRNETLLGDATQARNLARAQTFKALADDVEARSKGRAMAPQQAQVLQQLRNAQASELDQLKVSVAQTAAARQNIAAQERQAAAQAQAGARVAAAKEQRELQMFADKEAIKAAFAARGPEAASKLAEQTSQLATKLIDKDYPAAAGNYLDIARLVGIDPTTGKASTGSAAGLGLVNAGIITEQGRINRQAINALAERMAKSFGGVVTESDREAATRLLKGAGTVADIQRGVYAYGQSLGRNMRTLKAGNPTAFDAMGERLPLLREAAGIGETGDASRAAGFQAVK
jgi:hypothetical protein